MLLDFNIKTGTRFSLQDKRLFEISEVDITRVHFISIILTKEGKEKTLTQNVCVWGGGGGGGGEVGVACLHASFSLKFCACYKIPGRKIFTRRLYCIT